MSIKNRLTGHLRVSEYLQKKAVSSHFIQKELPVVNLWGKKINSQ